MRRRCLIAVLGLAAVGVAAGCPPSSDCEVTLDCGPYQNLAEGAGASGGAGSGGARDNGAPCSDAAECVSGLCVDAVCCDSVCDGVCEGCNVAGSEGVCTLEAAGTDPAGDCDGGSCDTGGVCALGACSFSQSFGSESTDQAAAVTTDAAGAVFLGGSFGNDPLDTIDFGGEELVSVGSDIYIAKFDGRGVHDWSYAYGDEGTQTLSALATDDTGAVVATGTFTNSVDFGGDTLTSTSVFTSDLFLVKLESDGSHAWSDGFGGDSNDYASAVHVDGNGNVIVTGRFTETIDFGDGERTGDLHDAYVAKFTSGGDLDWAGTYPGDDLVQSGLAVTTDPSDDAVIFAGYFSGSVDFGGDTLVSSASSQDAFVAKLDAEGDHLWSHRYGDGENQFFEGIASDDDGSVVAVGGFAGNLDAGGIVLVGMGEGDAMVVKLAADGSVVWARRFGDEETQSAHAVTIDRSGNVIVTGSFGGTIDFGGGPLLSEGSYDVFVVKLTADGTHLYSHRYGDNAYDQISAAIHADPTGAVVVAGGFRGGLDFGEGPLMTFGVTDVFLAKLSP